jgi:hypothetical protein
MAKIDSTIQKKIIDKITEMENSSTSTEFKSSLKMFFDVFVEKMKDDKSPMHIETFVSGVLQCINSIRLETKLSACLFLYSYINYLPDKGRSGYNKFADELEKEIAPKIYDMFLKLQSNYLNDKIFRESLTKKQLKHNILMVILLSILMILEICFNKFKVDKNNKTRRFEKFYNEIEVEEEIKEQLSNYSNLIFDTFENKVNFFEKVDNENPEEFKHKVKMILKTIAETREEMRFYLNVEIDNDSAKRFDEKTDDYKNQMYDLQEIIQNKRKLLDESLKNQISKEEQFSRFLLQDLTGLYAAEDLTINQAIKIISRKYEEIFSNDKEAEVDISHESIKLPEIQKQPYMRTDSELSDFISPNRFKFNPSNKTEEPNRAFFPSSQTDNFHDMPTQNAFDHFDNMGSNPFEMKEIGISDFQNIQGSLMDKSSKFGDAFGMNKQNIQNSNGLSRSLSLMDSEKNSNINRNIQRSETIKRQPTGQNNFEEDLPMSNEHSKDKIIEKDPFMAVTQNFNNFMKKENNNNRPTFGSANKKSPFADFEVPAPNPFMDDNNPKPVVSNFEDFDNFNQSFKFKSEDAEQKHPQMLISESQFESNPIANFSKFEIAKTESVNKNLDFNSIFLETSALGNPKDLFGVRQSNISIGNTMFKNSKLFNVSGIDKKNMSSFMDKKQNTKFQFGANKFSTNIKHETTHMSDNRAVISEALHKISTTINSKKISQVTIKSSNLNNSQQTTMTLINDRANNQSKPFGEALPLSIANDRKPGTPFMPAYGSSAKPVVVSVNKGMNSSNERKLSSVQINFPEPSNTSNSNLKVNQEISQDGKSKINTEIPNFTSVKVQDVVENNFIFEMDDFNSVHSDRNLTPPEQSIHNYSNMIPANLKLPLVKTPSNYNYSQNLGNVLPIDETNERKQRENNDRRFENVRPISSDLQIINDSRNINNTLQVNQNNYYDGPEEIEIVNGKPFENISTIRNTRIQSLEGTTKNAPMSATKYSRPYPTSIVSGLESKNEPSPNPANLSRTDMSDNVSQFVLDDKIVQAKFNLEKDIEGHKQHIKSLGNRLNSNQQTSQRQDEFADQIVQQYNTLFQKMIGDYEALIENNKYEMKEQKNYIDELLNQNEKYKYKTFNLENEIIGLKENNMRLNVSLNSLKKKYETGLSKQKEQIKQSSEAKLMAIERSYQEKIQTIKNDADINLIKLTEDVNNYIIENNNLKLDLEFSQGDKHSDVLNLKERIDGLRRGSGDIQRDMENGLKILRDYVKGDMTANDLKRVNTLKKARDELLDTLRSEQKKNEELSKQVITLSNECSVLKSNITFNPHILKASGERQDIVNVKVKTIKLKQMIKEASWIIHCMLNNMKHHLGNIKQLKMQELTKKMNNYENVTNSQLNELTKLNFQNQNLREELSHLKEKYENSLEQNKLMQKQILETRVQPVLNTGAISSDPEFIKKYRQLEYENKSLSDINREISSELIQCKERIIILQTENGNTEKLYVTLKNLEIENEELMEKNKCLFNELYETKLNLKNPSHSTYKSKGSMKDQNNSKYLNQQLMVRNQIPINANSITIVNNHPVVNQTQYNQHVDNSKYSTATGTAFIKKFDMFMEILNSQEKTKEESGKTLLDFMVNRPEREFNGIAQQCVQNSYCIIKTSSIKINVEETISFKNSTITANLRLNFINMGNTRINILNFKISCASNLLKIDDTNLVNIELQNFESQIKTFSVILEEKYLLQMSPVFISFCLLDQYLYNAYVSGSKDRHLVEDNFHVLSLPLSINKLLMTQQEDVSKFSIIKNLQKVGEEDIYNRKDISDEDLQKIFSNIVEISMKDRIYGVKINSLFGTFFLTILADNDTFNIKIFAMYQSPLHQTYLQTLKFILENL